PVELAPFHALHLLPELVAQRADALVVGRHFGLRQARGLAEADDLVRRQGAGAETALVAAAVDLRLEAHARLAAHIQRADAFGPVDLVRGDRQQVGAQLVHVDLDAPGALHGIAVA